MSQLEGSQGGLDALAAAVRDTQQQDAAGSPVAGAPHDALAQQKLGLQRLEACSRGKCKNINSFNSWVLLCCIPMMDQHKRTVTAECVY
jgi:hypothetical protein